ncbi:MAG: ATP-binding cassette domain-containing protein, partial [Planctomycetota bacterium]
NPCLAYSRQTLKFISLELSMIEVENLFVRASAFALSRISFQVPTRQYAVLMGKTGSGKTTLLETICGLRAQQSGRIVLNGRDITALKPRERGIGYVPQDAALFSTMTVREHLSFALVIRRWKQVEIERRVDELAEWLDLRALLNRKPAGLSGGETQRVALGRALASQPEILCLDEPLSALDEQTREDMYSVLKSVREHTHVTILHISHSIMDAQRLADLVLLLKDGCVQAVSPTGIVHRRDAENREGTAL